MPFLVELQEELEEISTLKFISAAYTEASASKIIKIRKAFERNRTYYEEISNVYHIVSVSAELQKLKSKDELDKSKKKTLSIAVTSNQRFYGNLNINTMIEFAKNSAEKKSDLLVIGKTGVDYLEMTRFKKDFERVLFEKDTPTPEEIKSVADRMVDYGTVLVYYPKFVNMLSQTISVADVTEAPESGEVSEDEVIRHIFEPELLDMLNFFEKQVRVVLFNRVMLEADLSRTAARLLTMSGAEDRANELMKEKKIEIAKVKRNERNAELLDTFTGIKQWKKK